MDHNLILGKRGRTTPSFHPHKHQKRDLQQPDENAHRFSNTESVLQAALQDYASQPDPAHHPTSCPQPDESARLHHPQQPLCDGHCIENSAIISCTDQTCPEEPCPDLGMCHSIDCLTPCFDSQCHAEPCPEGDACGSPCYSPGCDIPTCDDACPDTAIGNFHCTDDGQICFQQTSWDMSGCRCVDPACLQLRGSVVYPEDPAEESYQTDGDFSFPHCHEPNHCHHDFPSVMAPPPLPASRHHMGHDPYHWPDLLPHDHAFGDHSFDAYALDTPATPALTNSSSSSAFTTSSSRLQSYAPSEAEPVCQWIGGGCDHVCGHRFESSEELHLHVVEAHIKNLKREDKENNGFLCHWKGCDRYLCRSFTARPKLCRHVQCHSQYKPFSCSVCNMEFKTKDSREKHERTHTGQRPYKCNEPGCTSAFSTSTELRTHQIVHSGAKPYSCPLCSATFADSSNLSKHKATHMLGKFVCPDCGIRMRRWDQLRRHLVTQNHAKILLDDKRVQEEYKARMLKDFKDLPDEEKYIVKGGDEAALEDL